MAYVSRKDPDSVEHFFLDWSDYLAGDSIQTVEWIVPAGLAKVGEENTATSATVRLSGGEDGQDYEVVSRVSTAGERTADDAIFVRVRNDPSKDFPIPSDFKRGVFAEGGGLTDGDIMEMIRGWEARVAAANGGTLENEPFARSVVRQGAKAQFEGEVLRMSGRIDDGRRTFAESRAEAVMSSYASAKKEARTEVAETPPASVHNITEEPLF